MNFSLKDSKEVRVYPSYYTKIKANKVFSHFSFTVQNFWEGLFAFFLGIIGPISQAIGLNVIIGHTVTENVLFVNDFVAVTGYLTSSIDKLSIIPDYITPSYSMTLGLLSKNYIFPLCFQLLFGGISYFCYRKAKNCQEKLNNCRKQAQATENFNCKNCDNKCEVVFEPCMHVCSCKACSNKTETCFVCLRKIEKKIILYIA